MKRRSSIAAFAFAVAFAWGCTRENPDYFGEAPTADTSVIEPAEAGPPDGRVGSGDGGMLDGAPDPDGAPSDGAPPPDRGPESDARPEIDAAPDAAVDMAPDAAPLPVDGDDDGFDEEVDCDDTDPLRYPGAPERCNALDDDCDDAEDEGWAGRLGVPCTAGLGLCATAGVRVCNAAGDDVVCGAEPPEGSPELCNTADDDCDGIVDEGAANCCADGDVRPCGNGVGACQQGEQSCVDGAFGACEGSVGPRVERCDGVDEDCDGQTDEGLGVGSECVVGIGACRNIGLLACLPDAEIGCDAVPGEMMDELCNGLDDDCDGGVDEGFGIADRCAVGVGACERPGRITCDDDEAVCNAEPGAPGDEICNGLDDDCDGMADESVGGGMPCEVGEGQCRRVGQLVCNMAGNLACDTGPGPRADELCNGLDDDCDGVADEPFANLGDDCELAVGACRSAGRIVCGPDGEPACDAPPVAGDPETCNGIDDDCDGRTDEEQGLGAPCVAGLGACEAAGQTVCADDGGTRCGAEPGAAGDEACNGIDDDCDGQLDEGFELGAPCAVGVGACAADGVRICGPDGPTCDAIEGDSADEVCDGIDDDCDGDVDEGALNACGVCGPAPIELCNGEDDDCDGQVDEDAGPCVFPLGQLGAPEGASGFGRVMVDAGDLNGDGIGDALVGAPDGEAGLAAVISGADGTLVWQTVGIVTFGTSVAAGDMDGDGARELFVGAPGIENGFAIQLDVAGEPVRRIAGTNDFRAGRHMVAADGAPWLAMSDQDAIATFFGPAGAVRFVSFAGDDVQTTTLEGEPGEAMGERLFTVPDFGEDGQPDVIITGRSFVDRGTRLLVDPPADQRTDVLTPGNTNRSFGEAVVYGRLLADEPEVFAVGAHLASNRQTGAVFMYDTNGQRIGGILTNAGRNDRQAYRMALLPRPDADRDALIVGAQTMGEVRIWELLRGVDGRPVIATSAPIRAEDPTDSFGSALALTAPGPDGTRRLFVGEPDGAGGGRIHVYSAR